MELYSFKYKNSDKNIKLVFSEEFDYYYDGSSFSYIEKRFEFCDENDLPYLTSYEEILLLNCLNNNKNYKDFDMTMISGDREYILNEFEFVKYILIKDN